MVQTYKSDHYLATSKTELNAVLKIEGNLYEIRTVETNY